MTKTDRFSLILALTFICAFSMSAEAQTPRMTSVNITPESDRVRISAVGEATEMRIEVSDEQGEVVFQSGQITGQTLDWKMTDAQGARVQPGTYLVTVTFRTSAGKLRKRVEQVTVAEDEKASTKAAPAAPEAVQATVTTSGTTTAGKIAKFASASTITNSIITESSGKVGIGTAAPTTALNVVSAAASLPAILAGNNASGGIGVKGGSSNATGIGVWGVHTATSGVTPGVKGETSSTAANAVGVLGVVNPTNAGANSAAVRGTNKSKNGNGYGVYGEQAGSGTGVYGITSTGYGVVGMTNSNTGEGVGAGVAGFSTSGGDGVYGSSASGVGVDGAGVTGVSGSGSSYGVYGDGQSSGTGVYGRSLAGLAGLFDGRVRVASIPNTNGTDTGDVCFNAAGDLMNCRASSLRYKTNVQTFLGGLEIVQRLRPISFNWKESGVADIGLAAEEVAQIAPAFATTNNGEVVGVKYNRLNVLLINAIKEQQAEIEQLRARLRRVERTAKSRRSSRRRSTR